MRSLLEVFPMQHEETKEVGGGLSQCECLTVDGARCDALDFAGGDGRVICWTHRQAARVRVVALVDGGSIGTVAA